MNRLPDLSSIRNAATHLLRGLTWAVAALILGACASYSGAGLKPGISTRDEVRALMGEPVAVHAAAPGGAFSNSWEYPRGPAGRHTFMVRFDERGVVVAVDQVLTPKTLSAVRSGAHTREDVRTLLGRPAYVYSRIGGGEWWDYAAESQPGPRPWKRYIVTFDTAGMVVDAGEMFDPAENGAGRRR